MIRGQRVAVVIPSFRVEQHIQQVIRAMPASIDEIFVVIDASPDRSEEAALNSADPRVRILRHEVNQGVGGATVTGMLAALGANHDVIVKCDGDGQMDPANIPVLVQPIVEGWADHVKGSRYHHVRELRLMPRLRFIGNIGLTFLTKLASGYWHILDPVNGFFATRAEVLRAVPLRKLAKRFFFESDLLIRLNVVEARVVDIPFAARYGDEPTSLSITRTIVGFPPRLLAGLFKRVFWRYLFYDVSAVAVFGGLGLLLLLFSFLFGGYQWIAHATRGIPTPLGTIMVATVPLVFGFQLLLQAIVLDIYSTPRPGRREVDNERLLKNARLRFEQYVSTDRTRIAAEPADTESADQELMPHS